MTGIGIEIQPCSLDERLPTAKLLYGNLISQFTHTHTYIYLMIIYYTKTLLHTKWYESKFVLTNDSKTFKQITKITTHIQLQAVKKTVDLSICINAEKPI